MNPNSNRFPWASARLITMASLVAILACVPEVVLATDRDAHEDRAELRIKDMHAKLKITSVQEAQWIKVGETMRDNAKTMDALTQARFDHAKDMTAVDDLKSYAEIAEAHADGIRKLPPVFAALYDSMSDAQKKEADALFRHGDRKHGEHKHGDKLSSAK